MNTPKLTTLITQFKQEMATYQITVKNEFTSLKSDIERDQTIEKLTQYINAVPELASIGLQDILNHPYTNHREMKRAIK
jgi:hypothetical protein